MADAIRHARSVSPWFIPNKDGSADDFHGITSISGGATVDSEDVFVVGKETKCGTDKSIPDSTISVTQLERGEIQTYLTLANLNAEPGAGLTLSDFQNSLIDIVLYEKEESAGALEQTFWFPKMGIESIGFDISDQEARIERSFEFAGDNEHQLNYNNKYLIHVNDVAPSGTSGAYIINVSDPVPIIDPNNSGAYILRIDRTRAGVLTQNLVEGTDFTYASGGQDITITAGLTDDEYNVYYSASSFGSGGDPTSVDADSTCFLKAESVTVLLSDGTTEVELDLLTSLSIDATFTRVDEAVIGNDEKIIKEVQSKTVDVSLSGRLKSSTIAEAFMGELGNDHGITDVTKFLDNIRLTVKVYSDTTKASFVIGYQVDNLSFTDDSQDFTANDFGTLDVSSSSDDMLITTTEGNLT
jgi:hypothetical protein